jgi:hypothetical protein
VIGRLPQILRMVNKVVTLMRFVSYWDVMRGDVETYSIWWDKFSLSIPKIDYGSGFTDFDFSEMPWRDMINDSGFIPYKYVSLGV